MNYNTKKNCTVTQSDFDFLPQVQQRVRVPPADHPVQLRLRDVQTAPSQPPHTHFYCLFGEHQRFVCVDEDAY